jgi:hypothetical protein
MREFLINNSLEWDQDIARLRELWETVDRAFNDPLALQYAQKWLPQVSEQTSNILTNYENLANQDFSTAEGFQRLAEELETLADNEFIQFLFGDVTGVDLANITLGFTLMATLIKNELDGVIEAFNVFFEKVRSGENLFLALKDLYADVLTNMGSITSLLLQQVFELAGIDEFDSLISSLASGVSDEVAKAFLILGGELILFITTGFVRRAGTLVSIWAGVVDALFGTNLREPVTQFFDQVTIAVRNVLTIMGLLYTRINQVADVASGGVFGIFGVVVENAIGRAADALQ